MPSIRTDRPLTSVATAIGEGGCLSNSNLAGLSDTMRQPTQFTDTTIPAVGQTEALVRKKANNDRQSAASQEYNISILSLFLLTKDFTLICEN